MKMKPFVEGTTPLPEWRAFYNGKYQVQIRQMEDWDGDPIVCLAIRREDRKPIMDWRDLQWIKNQLLGPEVEMVQLFPAESRLIDTANQYYLYGYLHPGFRFPFGFRERMVSQNTSFQFPGHGTSKQRPFAEHVVPPDLEEKERIVKALLQGKDI